MKIRHRGEEMELLKIGLTFKVKKHIRQLDGVPVSMPDGWYWSYDDPAIFSLAHGPFKTKRAAESDMIEGIAREHTHNLLFVYGTLKRGHGNNHHILSNAKFIGAALSADCYRMLHGGVPFLLDDPEGHPVVGEIFAVNDEELAACDRLEGHPQHYQRVERSFLIGPDQPVTAWVYLWNPWQRAEDFLDRVQPDADGLIEWHPEDRRG